MPVYHSPMEQHTAKRVAKVKLTLTKRTVEALEPQDKPWIAWDDRLTGFGWRGGGSIATAMLADWTVEQLRRARPAHRRTDEMLILKSMMVSQW